MALFGLRVATATLEPSKVINQLSTIKLLAEGISRKLMGDL